MELLDYFAVVLLASLMAVVQSICSEIGKDIKRALVKRLKKEETKDADQHSCS